MFRRIWVLALGLIFFAQLSFAAEPATITVDEQQRTYLITQLGELGPKPTIIMLHGFGGNALVDSKASGLARLAPQAGFVAVFPNGLAHAWDHFPDGQVPASFQQQMQKSGVPVGNDVDFIKALVADLISRNIADANRIYIAGFSAGGFMAMRMVCVAPELFAAAALISSSMTLDTASDCHSAKPMPIIIIKGTADTTVPYNGGPVAHAASTVWSTDQLTSYFTQLDGCDQNAVERSDFPNPGQKNIEVKSWTKCSNGPVTLYTVEGGAHAIYKVPPPAETLWNFFKAHAR
jgi:polyhydroxybutyrate depolymerase